jgi:hypothetical protein
MAAEDLLERVDFDGSGEEETFLREDIVDDIGAGIRQDINYLHAATDLATLAHQELEKHATGKSTIINDPESILALKNLKLVLRRFGYDLALPFRGLASFRSYWIALDMVGEGSWAKRRRFLDETFNPVFAHLETLEFEGHTNRLAESVSPRRSLGWEGPDKEIAALRERFAYAKTPQDYKDIGNRCIGILETLGLLLYDQNVHLRDNEQPPLPDQTKQRLTRFIETAVPGEQNNELRGLARKVIELAHKTKHKNSESRRDAGISADAVILLASMLRRISDAQYEDRKPSIGRLE